MPDHKHDVGLPVILKDTWEVGTVSMLMPLQSGKVKYSILVKGRPDTPGKPQGASGSREVDEEIIGVGMNATEKINADNLMVGAMRGLSVDERASFRAEQETVRDDTNSGHHHINEAIRFLEALDIIAGE